MASGVYAPPTQMSDIPAVKKPSASQQSADVTKLLQAWEAGNTEALDELLPVVYRELHRLARRYMAAENPGHTLQASALVNEAYLELVDFQKMGWQNRAHFFGVAAQLMRRILVDFGRRRRYLREERECRPLRLDEGLEMAAAKTTNLVALDDARECTCRCRPAKRTCSRVAFLCRFNRGRDGGSAEGFPETVAKRLETYQSVASPRTPRRWWGMNAARWHQIKSVYNKALEMEATQRAAFLREACGVDR